MALSSLGATADARGDHEQAEVLLRGAVSIKEALFGPDHLDVAMTLNALGLALRHQGRARDAAGVYGRALEIFSGRLPADDLRVVTCRANLAAAQAIEAQRPGVA